MYMVDIIGFLHCRNLDILKSILSIIFQANNIFLTAQIYVPCHQFLS